MSRGLHALIVEDEIIAGVGMQLVLGDLGFESFAFSGTATQAVEQALLRRPDLVTMDERLLHGDGLEAAARIRGAIGSAPTVFVTGDARALKDDPAAVVVEKPYGPADMARAFARAREINVRDEALSEARRSA